MAANCYPKGGGGGGSIAAKVEYFLSDDVDGEHKESGEVKSVVEV